MTHESNKNNSRTLCALEQILTKPSSIAQTRHVRFNSDSHKNMSGIKAKHMHVISDQRHLSVKVTHKKSENSADLHQKNDKKGMNYQELNEITSIPRLMNTRKYQH